MKKYLLDDFEFSQSFLFYFDKVHKKFNIIFCRLVTYHCSVQSDRYELYLNDILLICLAAGTLQLFS